MAITARVGNIDKYAVPKGKGGGGIAGFIREVVGAPGGELGPAPLAIPGMVFQKAGVPSLRALLGVQSAGKVSQAAAPMVRTTRQRIGTAMTGKPFTGVGFRGQAPGGPVPGRGLFYGATPAQAKPVVPTTVAPIGSVVPESVAKSADVLKLKNPVVVGAGGQEQLLRTWVSHPPKGLSPTVKAAGRTLLKQTQRDVGFDVEKWFSRADKWLARVAKAQGHDGIIYKDRGEIVDLAGTVTKRAK